MEKGVILFNIYCKFVYYVRIIQSPLHETDNAKFVAVFSVGLTCNSVIKFSLLSLADQKRMFGLPSPLTTDLSIFSKQQPTNSCVLSEPEFRLLFHVTVASFAYITH